MTDWTPRIVCTDRGQHPDRWLGKLTPTGNVIPTDERRDAAADTSMGYIDQDHDRAQGGWGVTYPLPPCPTCGRHTTMKQDHWERIYTEYVAAGWRTVDISHLPH